VADPQHAGAIARWLDQSPNGNDATPTNGDIVLIHPAVINGHDAIECPANGNYLAVKDSASLDWGTGDFGLIAVARFGGPAYAWEKIDPNGGGPGVAFGETNGGYTVYTPGASAVLAAGNVNSFHILAGRGARLRLEADGLTATGPTSTQDISFPGSANAVCLLTGASSSTSTELAELILVKGALSDADLASAVAYLKNKFKL
jgi:hypothetical protein